MSVVVTGATGKLGRLVVERLLARGLDPRLITATGRDRAALRDVADLGVVAVASDYDDRASLAAVFEGADTLMFVSGSEVGARVPQHTNVVEVARDARVGWIVYTSCPQAATTQLVVAPEHRYTEELIAASGIPYTFLRNNWYSENYVADLEQADRQNEVVHGWNEGRVASAARLDYAEAAAVVLTTSGHEGTIYELSGDTAWNGDDLAHAASVILGHPVVYARRTEDERQIDLHQAGVDDRRARFLIELDRDIRDGMLGTVYPDLARLIGRRTTPLVEALRAEYARG